MPPAHLKLATSTDTPTDIKPITDESLSWTPVTELLERICPGATRVLDGVDMEGKPLTLRTLLEQPPKAFSAHGIDTHGYNLLRTAIELGRRYIRAEVHKGRTLHKAEDASLALIERMRDLRREVFVCLYLDNRHRIIELEEFAQGTVNETRIYVRELARRALELDACALIIAHNHPSGNKEISPSDRNITKKIDDALKLFEIRLLDHLVIADGHCASFHKLGLLPKR